MSLNFSIIRGMIAGAEKRAQDSRVVLADTQGALAPHRIVAKSLAQPSHPDARRVIAESPSTDISNLHSTRGPADQFRRAIVLGANRA